MPTKAPVDVGLGLQDVRVDAVRVAGPSRGVVYADNSATSTEVGIHNVSRAGSNFAYVNPAYSGSLNSVRDKRAPTVQEPPTSVIREQYWMCSKWPFVQRVLALAVGVLLGAVVGLILTLTFKSEDKDEKVGFIFGSP